jgi:hypothetical protein
MHQQLWGTKLSGKVSLGVRGEKRLNTTGLRIAEALAVVLMLIMVIVDRFQKLSASCSKNKMDSGRTVVCIRYAHYGKQGRLSEDNLSYYILITK